jgi:NAD(P)-dependent dehydrogenase (short-subunit alcohol dehydrogenase family)
VNTVPTPATLFDLTSKRAVVVGGTGVLGGRFARCLAAAGAEVIVLGRSAERGAAVVADIVATGGRGSFTEMDVVNRTSVTRVSEDLAQTGGTDILVNAAGKNSRTPFADLTEEEWRELLDINVGAVYRVCQLFAPQMSNREGGATIINVSSASSGPPLSRVFAYGAAKSAVNNVTQYLARELAPQHVRVNAIIPGFFPAEQNRALLTPERIASIVGHTPLGRLGEPEELDGVLLWLASSRASGFVTGALVHVDGGFSAMTI